MFTKINSDLNTNASIKNSTGETQQYINLDTRRPDDTSVKVFFNSNLT